MYTNLIVTTLYNRWSIMLNTERIIFPRYSLAPFFASSLYLHRNALHLNEEEIYCKLSTIKEFLNFHFFDGIYFDCENTFLLKKRTSDTFAGTDNFNLISCTYQN